MQLKKIDGGVFRWEKNILILNDFIDKNWYMLSVDPILDFTMIPIIIYIIHAKLLSIELVSIEAYTVR